MVSEKGLQVVQCTFARHAPAILAILNDTILNSTALYDYKPRTLDNLADWFATKRTADFPVIGIENRAGELIAFGSYGSFRAFPAYKYTVEHSVYVDHRHRGQGLGRMILRELIDAALRQQFHAMMGVIDATNTGSVALHEKLGFRHVATLPEVGFKFGRWLDVSLYQLLLPTPAEPVDG